MAVIAATKIKLRFMAHSPIIYSIGICRKTYRKASKSSEEQGVEQWVVSPPSDDNWESKRVQRNSPYPIYSSHAHASYPVFVHRLTLSLHASFRPPSLDSPCVSLTLHLHQVG